MRYNLEKEYKERVYGFYAGNVQITTVFTLFIISVSLLMLLQEKRLRVNMRLKKLREKVKEHQERVGEKVWPLMLNVLDLQVHW